VIRSHGLRDEPLKQLMPNRLLKFALTGGIGLLADAGALALLIKVLGLDPFTARLIAIAFALAVTWLINRNFTFGKSQHSLGGEALRYGGVGIAGSAINYVIYSAILIAAPQMGAFLALCLASAAVMVLSYAGYSRLVFQAK
jgi:putative flippase GtrA